MRLLYIVFLYLPVVFLPIFSFNTSAVPKFPLSGFTLKWYEELPRTPALLDAAWNSLVVGVSAAILATVLGICAARAITRYRFPGRTAINGLIMAPLVLPEIIVAISMLLVMLQLGLSLSLFTVVLGHVLICIPYSMTVLTSGFEGFDRSLEEASADLGETAFGTFRRVTLPMVAPAIISSLLVSFTISLDEFIMAFFLTGTDARCPSTSGASCASPPSCPACWRWARCCWSAPSSFSPSPRRCAAAPPGASRTREARLPDRPMIEIRNVTRSYGSFKALDDAS